MCYRRTRRGMRSTEWKMRCIRTGEIHEAMSLVREVRGSAADAAFLMNARGLQVWLRQATFLSVRRECGADDKRDDTKFDLAGRQAAAKAYGN
jgi:hypothetical protein